MPPSFRAVLFDGDGVVFNTERIVNECFCRILQSRGIDMTMEKVAPYRGIDTRDLMARLRDELGLQMTADEYSSIRDAMYPDVCREKNGPRLIEGIVELLDWLDARRIPFAMGTGSTPNRLEFNFAQTEMKERFRIFVTAADVARGKPAPDTYLETARRLGVSAAECLIIEDTKAGLISAKAAGGVPIAILGTEPKDELAGHAVALFDDHFALRAWLEGKDGIADREPGIGESIGARKGA